MYAISKYTLLNINEIMIYAPTLTFLSLENVYQTYEKELYLKRKYRTNKKPIC